MGTATRNVQAREIWASDEEIQNMKFTNRWIKSFLFRGGVTRRKITREDKEVPSDEEIASVLSIGQRKFIENGHTAGSLAHKHSVSSEKRPDQTTMTVIRDLNKKDGFTSNDGWKLKEWSRELTINNVSAVHKALHIIHEEMGDVITSQVKAWNDTVRMILWFEVLRKPIKDKIGKMLLWCDNCCSHKTTCVIDVIREIGVDVVFLPKSMTGELQVLDLVVIGPLKAHIRSNKANRLYSSFHEYKKERDINNNLPRAQRNKMNFNSPKPTMLEGIQDLRRLFKEQMIDFFLKSVFTELL